ncbi:MAG: lipoate--protein ligase family protein [Verrucomicrobia bacterium]|nr:lipoate--protein ligase family protein [Verrucomicrobiota bacterium]MBT5062393.1 lipoate--protein ligase family protein [Verrucomicrobiota bacterium]MBT7534864.1 lipoate--protein ligase family protein [Verrucomicrobiota bacterium]
MDRNEICRVNVGAATVREHLIWDEYLLRACEDGQIGPSIRTWVVNEPTVVLGYSNRPDREVHMALCRQRGIPVLRRTSGGGTVLLDAGCLNYSLILPVAYHPSMASVTLTNQYIMEKQRGLLEECLGREVALKGHTDLVIGERKVSGNAQRRGRSTVLFHGSFLCNADLGLIDKVLAFPSRQPAYRLARGHSQFLINLGISVSDLSQAVLSYWVKNSENMTDIIRSEAIWKDCSGRLEQSSKPWR